MAFIFDSLPFPFATSQSHFYHPHYQHLRPYRQSSYQYHPTFYQFYPKPQSQCLDQDMYYNDENYNGNNENSEDFDDYDEDQVVYSPSLQRQKLIQQRKEEKAALMIQKFMKTAKVKRETVNLVLLPLRKLRLIESNLSQIRERYETLKQVFSKELSFEEPLVKPDEEEDEWRADCVRIKFGCEQNKDLLEYEDTLTKLLIEIDKIESNGFEIIRDTRKSLILNIQAILDQIDTYKTIQKQIFLSSLAR